MKPVTALLAAAVMALSSQAAAQVGPAISGPPSPGPRCLAGEYDGGQMEIAASIELTDDQQFRYTLSYGAIDEMAEGRWERAPGGVLLTSDPITPPAFALDGQTAEAGRTLTLTLDVPRGVSRQYFDAIVRFADGRVVQRQFTEDGLAFDLGPEARPVGVAVFLPLFDVQSETYPVSFAAGGDVRIRFTPNDLGKVAFDRTEARFDKQDLLLDRHDRTIRFRRKGNCETVM